MKRLTIRAVGVLVHRWVGLAMAGFLVVASLTGSLLAWYEELDAAINPHLFHVALPGPDARPLDVLVLRELTARQTGEALRYFLLRPPRPGHAVVFRLDKQDREEIFVDPYTGHVLGRRVWGDLRQGVTNFMPFIYRLHNSLALGVFGNYLLGIVALLWTVDCFVGAYLTFPTTRQNFWQRWSKAWQLRMNGGTYKVSFDLHRAVGLWVWPVLLVFAWSSVAFNLNEVYDPVMDTLFEHERRPTHLARRKSNAHPGLDWWQARETGRRLITEQAQKHGFAVLAEDWFVHEPALNLYFYDVRSSLDVTDHKHKALTRLYFDADSGELLYLSLPTGVAAGDTIRTWITSLHRAALWGYPFKLLVTCLGFAVAMLSVTGVLIWLRKRDAKVRSEAKRSSPAT